MHIWGRDRAAPALPPDQEQPAPGQARALLSAEPSSPGDEASRHHLLPRHRQVLTETLCICCKQEQPWHRKAACCASAGRHVICDPRALPREGCCSGVPAKGCFCSAARAAGSSWLPTEQCTRDGTVPELLAWALNPRCSSTWKVPRYFKRTCKVFLPNPDAFHFAIHYLWMPCTICALLPASIILHGLQALFTWHVPSAACTHTKQKPTEQLALTANRIWFYLSILFFSFVLWYIHCSDMFGFLVWMVPFIKNINYFNFNAYWGFQSLKCRELWGTKNKGTVKNIYYKRFLKPWCGILLSSPVPRLAGY